MGDNLKQERENFFLKKGFTLPEIHQFHEIITAQLAGNTDRKKMLQEELSGELPARYKDFFIIYKSDYRRHLRRKQALSPRQEINLAEFELAIPAEQPLIFNPVFTPAVLPQGSVHQNQNTAINPKNRPR